MIMPTVFTPMRCLARLLLLVLTVGAAVTLPTPYASAETQVDATTAAPAAPFVPPPASAGPKLEDLPPCYSAVVVTYSSSGVPASKTWRWHQEEGGTGALVEPGDNRCN
jgi:hypothetical protein